MNKEKRVVTRTDTRTSHSDGEKNERKEVEIKKGSLGKGEKEGERKKLRGRRWALFDFSLSLSNGVCDGRREGL